MGPLTLSAIAAPFVAKGSEAFSKSAGEKLGAKVGELCQAVIDKFKGDSDAEETLALAQKKPDSKGRQSALEEVLAEKLEADPDFALKVQRLVDELQKGGSRTVFDQRGQTVRGAQTNIAGNVSGSVLSGQFSGPVALGGEAVDMRGSTGAIYKPSGSVEQHYGDRINITGDGNVVGNHNRTTIAKGVTPSMPIAGAPGVDFLLVTPLPEERDAVLNKLIGYKKVPPMDDDIHTYYKAEVNATFPDGNTDLYRVIVLPLLGMGLVQAATATTTAIDRWRPRYIVVIGIAGGIAAKGIQIGDILIADQIANYELQKVTPEGPEIRWDVHQVDPRLLSACNNFIGESWKELLQVERPGQGEPRRFNGPIASGGKVIAFGEYLKKPQEAWPKLIGVEMEAAGAAKAAFQSSAGSGFFMVRCVSDLADEKKESVDVRKWRYYACDVAASFAIALLRSGPVPIR